MDLTYITSGLEPESWPKLVGPDGKELPEIALAGRSNVGKSTFLNLLAGKKLAKVSATPGKTQRIQFFEGKGCAIVDLPGYGYAEAPEKFQAEWSEKVHTYFETRSQLKKLLLLLDIRRIPSKDDLQLLGWAAGKIEVQIVVTKTDLVSKSECEKQMEAISRHTNTETLMSVPAPRRIVWNRVLK